MLREGVNAHWGVLKGFAFPVEEEALRQAGVVSTPYGDKGEVLYAEVDGAGAMRCHQGACLEANENEIALVFVQGLGTACRQVVVPLRQLRESNGQLHCRREECKELDAHKVATLCRACILLDPQSLAVGAP